jgi:predicted PurR-regulated permease PerM
MNDSSATPRNSRKDILFAFALAFAGLLLWVLRDALVLLYVSALFAVILMPVVHAISGHRIGRWRFRERSAIFIMFLCAAGALTAFGFLAIPPVVHDLQQLSSQPSKNVPALLKEIRNIRFLERVDGGALSSRLQSWASTAAAQLLVYLKDLASKLFSFGAGLVLTIYFILDGNRAYHWFLSLVSPRRRARLDVALRRAADGMGKWLLGQASLMLILGICSTIVYVALKVRYAYALGFLTGLLNIIPVLGAAISIILVLAIAAIDSWGRVLGVAIFYIVYIQVENSFLTPRIMQNRIGLPGLAVLVALMLGFALAGVLGALVSVPTAVLVEVLIDEYLVWKDMPFEGPP